MTRMGDSDLRALLGDFYDELDDEQRTVIVHAAELIDQRWPDPDAAEERRLALNAAMAMVYGDDTDVDAARDYLSARAAEVYARARLTGAIIAGSLLNPAEKEAPRAKRLGISRLTLRKALGKNQAKRGETR